MYAPHALAAGSVFHDKYQVVRWIGSGGFGHVYEVKHLKFRTDPLALKVAHELESEESVASFFAEVDLLRRLHSRHVVAVRDAHVTPEGLCYFTTDLAPGVPLDTLLRDRRPLEWRHAASIACQVLEALAEAHGEGIVHRDVKPENVMVEAREGKEPFVRMLDFGIAKLTSRARPGGPTRAVGTPAYMSPEQFRGEPVDGRADLYAVGILLFECLTGRYPLDVPLDASPAVFMYAHLQLAPATVRASRPDVQVPPGLDEVIRRALEKSPDARFATAAAMREALLEVVRSEEGTEQGRIPTPPPPVAAPAPEPSLGEVGPYVLERVLGAGQFGQVFRARRKDGGAPVALKVQREDWVGDPVQIERFRREAEMAARVRHPSAVSVLDHGEHAGHPYVAFELVEGEPLDGLLEAGPLEPARAAAVIRDVLDALAAIHEAGIIHRDVKPRNVLLTREGAAKLCDFGIGRVVAGQGADAPRLTIAGDFIGTPAYAAPEMWRGAPIDARTDLYALGAMIYEMLTGARPFTATEAHAIMSAHLKTPPPRLAEGRPALGPRPALDAAIGRLLAKDPAARFASARDAWSALAVAFDVVGKLPPLRAPSGVPAVPPRVDATVPLSLAGVRGPGRGGDTAEIPGASSLATSLATPPPGTGTVSPWTIETHARLVSADRTDFVIATQTLRFGRDKPSGDPQRDNALVLRVLPCRSAESDPDGFRRTLEISKVHGELIVADDRVALVDRSTRGIELEGSRVAKDMIVPLPPRFRLVLLGADLVLVGRIFPEAPGSSRPGAVRLQRLGNASQHAYVWIISTAEIGTHGGPIPHPEEGSFGSALRRADGRLLLEAPGRAPRPLVHGEQLRGRFETILVGAARPEDMVTLS